MKRKLLLLLTIAIACFGFINAQSSIAVKTQETIKAAINGDAKAQDVFCEMLYYQLFDKASLTADAVSKVQKLANEGQAWAQDIMGEVCYSGLAGFTKDEAKAQEWFQKAANQGYAWGITTCGTVCRNNKDYDKALEYYRKAADMGHVAALTGLGQLYQEGNGVEKNLGKALEYYRSAADKGSAVSMFYLGFMYFSGDGVEKNIEESKKWLLKAGEAGLSYGFSNLGGLYNMSEDYSIAMEYFRKAADMGNGEAMCQIGLLYDSGKGVAKNIDTANQWYLKAGEAGDSNGYLNLANNYKSAKKYDKAVSYFHKAVEMGNEDAIKEEANFIKTIADDYYSAEDYAKALEYYCKAADLGNASAMNQLGMMYYYGLGVTKDLVKAQQWYSQASEKASVMKKLYNLLPPHPQFKPNIPSDHNAKLDVTLRKFIETNEDREYEKKIIDNVYNNYGTYLASAIVQHMIDYMNFSAFLNSKTYILTENDPKLGKMIEGFGPDFYKNVTPFSEHIHKWLNNNYSPLIFFALKFDLKPKADEVIKRLDDMAKNNELFDKKNISEYLILSNNYTREKTNGKIDTQALSDIIAYKMFLFDELMFLNSLDSSGLSYSKGHFEYNHRSIRDYFEMWMDSVSPESLNN